MSGLMLLGGFDGYSCYLSLLGHGGEVRRRDARSERGKEGRLCGRAGRRDTDRQSSKFWLVGNWRTLTRLAATSLSRSAGKRTDEASCTKLAHSVKARWRLLRHGGQLSWSWST